MSETIRDLMKLKISDEIFEGESMSWLKNIIVHETEKISVENVYHYYSKADKQLIFHLRVLIKSLLEEFERISKTGQVKIQLD